MNLEERLSGFSTANVSDVQQSLGVLHFDIKPLRESMRILGPAFTVKAYPGSIVTVHKALAEASPGDVLVVDGEGSVGDGAMFGEIMALQAKSLGLAGLVVDGGIRDADGISEYGFPVFARGVTPRVGTNRRLGLTQVPISCGGVLVQPGDIILADINGVVRIGQDELDGVVERLHALRQKENELVAGIEKGKHVADMLGFRELFN